MAITLTDVSKRYGKQKALDQVSFTLHEGEICGFLGPNGAGKSTTMKIITGFLTDFEGEVNVNGLDIRKHPLQAKELIGYLPEHNPLYPDMYIREYLLHVARLYRVTKARQRVEKIIEDTGLTPESGKKIGQLSKGYRQRVGLAQALIHDPQVLILDEPMTGLDPNQLEEIRELIIRTGRNKTVLLSTHIMQEVQAVCDRVIIINQGKIATDKPIQEVGSMANGSVISVRFAPGTDSEWLQETNLFDNIRRVSADSWLLTPPPHQDPRIDLFKEAAAHNSPIIELKMEETNLEEIFHALTKKINV